MNTNIPYAIHELVIKCMNVFELLLISILFMKHQIAKQQKTNKACFYFLELTKTMMTKL